MKKSTPFLAILAVAACNGTVETKDENEDVFLEPDASPEIAALGSVPKICRGTYTHADGDQICSLEEGGYVEWAFPNGAYVQSGNPPAWLEWENLYGTMHYDSTYPTYAFGADEDDDDAGRMVRRSNFTVWFAEADAECRYRINVHEDDVRWVFLTGHRDYGEIETWRVGSAVSDHPPLAFHVRFRIPDNTFRTYRGYWAPAHPVSTHRFSTVAELTDFLLASVADADTAEIRTIEVHLNGIGGVDCPTWSAIMPDADDRGTRVRTRRYGDRRGVTHTFRNLRNGIEPRWWQMTDENCNDVYGGSP